MLEFPYRESCSGEAVGLRRKFHYIQAVELSRSFSLIYLLMIYVATFPSSLRSDEEWRKEKHFLLIKYPVSDFIYSAERSRSSINIERHIHRIILFIKCGTSCGCSISMLLTSLYIENPSREVEATRQVKQATRSFLFDQRMLHGIGKLFCLFANRSLACEAFLCRFPPLQSFRSYYFSLFSLTAKQTIPTNNDSHQTFIMEAELFRIDDNRYLGQPLNELNLGKPRKLLLPH